MAGIRAWWAKRKQRKLERRAEDPGSVVDVQEIERWSAEADRGLAESDYTRRSWNQGP
jgi:hypothetical protein